MPPAFPVGTLLAQTWDPAMLEEVGRAGMDAVDKVVGGHDGEEVGRAVGREMAEYGITWWLAPGMNIHRDPSARAAAMSAMSSSVPGMIRSLPA